MHIYICIYMNINKHVYSYGIMYRDTFLHIHTRTYMYI